MLNVFLLWWNFVFVLAFWTFIENIHGFAKTVFLIVFSFLGVSAVQAMVQVPVPLPIIQYPLYKISGAWEFVLVMQAILL